MKAIRFVSCRPLNYLFKNVPIMVAISVPNNIVTKVLQKQLLYRSPETINYFSVKLSNLPVPFSPPLKSLL